LLFAVATSLVSVESALDRPTMFASGMFVTSAPSPASSPAVNLPPISRLSAGPIFLSWPS
jgi:hypothetical protein